MNELVDKFGSDDFTIFAFPCNQFFRQSQDTDAETLNLLKHVRPGDGYVPKFEHSTKIEVNGAGAHPIFTWLRESLPNPVDEAGKEIMGDHTRIAWDPVCRNDLSWNFEKFLINQEGVPVRRYSPKHETIDVAADIEKLIKDGPNALA
jgi:glutathione peroxidase|uniref:Glutathione peroxidase n=1 Tax=Prasinoderma singulare TaxID=676789 RepID=A0A7S3BLC1_9VIRI|mmetsp:Transcript_19655/g.61032  ORF Transcript_19655/g.61032 Transcript_19655/m.61032 type:complete len:148 (+) Transcript_19655:277-720(+)